MSAFSAMSLHPPGAHLVITGEFDICASAQLRCRLDDAVAAGCTQFTVDVSAVTFVDAAGIGTLVRLLNTVQPLGGTVEVCAASQDFRSVAALVGLETVFGLEKLTEGMRATGPGSRGRASREGATASRRSRLRLFRRHVQHPALEDARRVRDRWGGYRSA